MVCVLSAIFFFLSFFFFQIFYRYFLWQTLTIHRIAEKEEGIIIFLFFHFQPLTNIHLVNRDFYHFFLIDLFVITRLITDETCSPFRDLHFICIYIDAIKWHCQNLSSDQTIALLLQIEPCDLLILTPLTTTVYLSHLPNPNLSHQLPSIRLPKFVRNGGCFINKFSHLIIYLDFEASMTTHELITKRSYRQNCLFSDWVGLWPFSEIIIADNKMVVAIHFREKEKI